MNKPQINHHYIAILEGIAPQLQMEPIYYSQLCPARINIIEWNNQETLGPATLRNASENDINFVALESPPSGPSPPTQSLTQE